MGSTNCINFLPGMIIGIEVPLVVAFQWNPLTVKRHKQNRWHPVSPAGREQPIYHFGAGGAQTYTFEADLSYGRGSVSALIDSLFELMKPLVKGKSVDRPPLCQLVLGATINTTCFISKVDATYGPVWSALGLLPNQGKFNITVTEFK